MCIICTYLWGTCAEGVVFFGTADAAVALQLQYLVTVASLIDLDSVDVPSDSNVFTGTALSAL